ncbi:MAG: hypothetical protein L3J57_10900 [Desulfuromusa sp.]|nr:hypothetical protein [Desulfuromusa sp.]
MSLIIHPQHASNPMAAPSATVAEAKLQELYPVLGLSPSPGGVQKMTIII